MSDMNSAEEKQAVVPETTEPAPSPKPAPAPAARAPRKTAAKPKPEPEAPEAKPKRPVPPPRPSIYESITNTAKQKEAERAARAAANKANVASQNSAKTAATPAQAGKRPVSPFLSAPIGRITPPKPVATAADEEKDAAPSVAEFDTQAKAAAVVGAEAPLIAAPSAAADLAAKAGAEANSLAPDASTVAIDELKNGETAKAEPAAEKKSDAPAAPHKNADEIAPLPKPGLPRPIIPARPGQPAAKGVPSAGGQSVRPPQRPQTGQPQNRPQQSGGYAQNRPAGQSGQLQNRPATGQSGQPQNRPSTGQPGQSQNRPPSGQPGQSQNRPQAPSNLSQNRPATTSGQSQNRPAQPPTARPQQGNTQSRPQQGRPSGGGYQGNRPQYGNQQRGGHRPGGRAAPATTPRPVTPPPPPAPTGPVFLPQVITVRDLITLLNIPLGEMLKKLMTLGIFATVNQSLDYETASSIAEEFDIKSMPLDVAPPKPEMQTASIRTSTDARKGGESRPPVVVIMGHVDHGKTSLLDAIRSANVAAGEAGGITQHIGAYQVENAGRKITFLDTPGHEAFTAMRARGAQLTDIAVLVVAADDGVMPQTIEAINHARAANVPIIVALNKIDRETADPARVMRQLGEANVLVEDWGGDVPMVKVSARKMLGINELLDMILLVADLAEHKADPNLPAIGTVVEAEMDRSRGPVATMLVQNGTLRQNDYLVIGSIQGRVRAMFDDRGNRLSEAGPSMPAVVLGLPSVPEAGTTFQVVADERTAKNLAEQATEAVTSAQSMRAAKALSLDDLYAQMQAGKMHELNLVLKADVQGSLEPIRSSLEKLSTESLRVRILHQGLGNVSESDVSLALASTAIVIGFNVDTDTAAKRLATVEGVDVREYRIIYKLIEDVDKALKGLLEPTYKEVISGKAEVRQVFKVSKKAVAGSYVTEGKAVRSGQARVLRGGKPVYDGRVASLKRFTEDAREVLTGFECGVMLENFEEIKQGDIIEFYHKEKVE